MNETATDTAPFFERLTAMDATFLELEDEHASMHVGAVVLFDVGPLATPEGGVDIARLREYIEAVITKVPRYRQRLHITPVVKHPVWVDDHHFNIQYHVRHTALPKPGTDRQLKRLAGRIFSQRLDRSRPLWEFWVVEGVDEGRFALIAKAHHCMVDGMSGVALMAALLRMNASQKMPQSKPWSPRPLPGKADLLRAEVKHRVGGPVKLWQKLVGESEEAAAKVWDEAGKGFDGLMQTLSVGLKGTTRTSLSTTLLDPFRRFDVLDLDLAGIKTVKNAFGGKVNDVVLALVHGALRRFLSRRGIDLSGVQDFKVLVPVSTRAMGKANKDIGNSVALMLVKLPMAESDTATAYRAIVAETQALKSDGGMVAGSDLFERLGDYAGGNLVASGASLAMKFRPFNLVVTNVPGPPMPLYLLGAKVSAIHPMVPLLGHTTLGIALFSYCGRLQFGFTGDWAATDDLHLLVEDMQAAFKELLALAAEVHEAKAATA